MNNGGSPGRGGDDELEGGPELPLTPSVVFGVLADKRNRFALYLVRERGGTVPLDELARHVAAWENDSEPELITGEIEQRVRHRLYHVSVPKLAEYGLVTTTRDSEAVTLTERGERLEPYLEFARERELRDVDAFLERNRPNCG